jgi:formate C-acetyltransferase
MEQWRNFKGTDWQDKIDVKSFIRQNYTPYEGDSNFLVKTATERMQKLNAKYDALRKEELDKGGVLDVDTKTVSTITGFEPGYLDKDNEIIVGLQTDAPLKRAINPFGGIRMAVQACKEYGYEVDQDIFDAFKYHKTHNDGVFSCYSSDMRKARHAHILTGLPDAYGRGRLIGDYRRVALYGVDAIIERKKADKTSLQTLDMSEQVVRKIEEVQSQIDALNDLKKMALSYGYDISQPANNAKEAVQWTYFAYLAAIKEQNGAAMSLGRTSTFFDIYFERDFAEGKMTEEQAQEIMDDFVLKLRMSRQLRTPEYNELFAGDPNWVTESIGGMSSDGRTLVTKNSYRVLNTLYTLNPAPEPNLTVLWSNRLPENFKKFCAKVSIDTDSIQYENDDLMRDMYGDDYAIACCVSATEVGKQMQFFGARANVPKMLLMAINGGRDEIHGEQIGPVGEVLDGVLDYDKVMERFHVYTAWLAKLYVNTLNLIHFMHDKYAYEKIQMALHDTNVKRILACGMAGLSVAADSLSAIKYAKVTPIRDERGIAVDFKIEGDFPKYGNDDDRVDLIARQFCEDFERELELTPSYRGAKHTLSVLTITSNVMYGKNTGATPDGRKAGEPFAPGANPMHGRDSSGAVASLNSVAKLPYDCCRDGISNTFSITPNALGTDDGSQVDNLVALLDGYFFQPAHHLNVNVLNRETLQDAYEHPEKYPNLTIRVSGYAVHFTRLTKDKQLEVISRTFHQSR